MNYTMIYTKTYTVNIEAESLDQAVEQWEEMDLEASESGHEPPVLYAVEYQNANGYPSRTYY
jgi:hypothetical protein